MCSSITVLFKEFGSFWPMRSPWDEDLSSLNFFVGMNNKTFYNGNRGWFQDEHAVDSRIFRIMQAFLRRTKNRKRRLRLAKIPASLPHFGLLQPQPPLRGYPHGWGLLPPPSFLCLWHIPRVCRKFLSLMMSAYGKKDWISNIYAPVNVVIINVISVWLNSSWPMSWESLGDADKPLDVRVDVD